MTDYRIDWLVFSVWTGLLALTAPVWLLTYWAVWQGASWLLWNAAQGAVRLAVLLSGVAL